ncbi:MAG: hypothetical protein GXP43_00380 [bacterium]|nr:hypothetical protein [bacterium]
MDLNNSFQPPNKTAESEQGFLPKEKAGEPASPPPKLPPAQPPIGLPAKGAGDKNGGTSNKQKTATLWLGLLAGVILIVIPVGIIIAKKVLVKKPTAYPVGVGGKVVCYPDGGISKKYDSGKLVVENNKNENVRIWVQWNKCSYDPNNPPKEGYQCNTYVKRNPYILGPGQKMEFSAQMDGSGLEGEDLTGKVVQIDANTDEEGAGGCYLPDGQPWQGGLAFAIKAYPAPTAPAAEGKVVCYPKGGMAKKYDSDTLVVENKKNKNVEVWVQWNKCDYNGQTPPAQGYQCNTYVKRNPYILGPGQKMEFSAQMDGSGLENANLNCGAVQIDASTVKSEDGGCYLPDASTLWSGGLGWTIKAYGCQTTTPTPTPTPTQRACQVRIDGLFKEGGKYEVTLSGTERYVKAAAYVCGGYNNSYCDVRGPSFVNSYWLIGSGGDAKSKWGSLTGSKKFEVDYQCGGSVQVDVNYCKTWSQDGGRCLEPVQCSNRLDKTPDCTTPTPSPTPTMPPLGTACYQGIIVKVNGQDYTNQVLKPGDKLTFRGQGVTDVGKNINNVYFTVFKGDQKVDEGDGYDLSYDLTGDRKVYSALYDFTIPADGYGDYKVSVAVHEPTDGWSCTTN